MRYLFAGCSLFNHIMQYKCATQVKLNSSNVARLIKYFIVYRVSSCKNCGTTTLNSGRT